MVVFRHTDTTSSSQANGISFDISHSCVDFIVRYIHFLHFPVVPLDFILSFHPILSRAQEAWAAGAPTIRGAQTGKRARPRP